MTADTNAPVRPVPEGFHTITPHLVILGGGGATAALAFYAKAFGGVEISRTAGPDGRLWNAQMRIGDSMIMLVDHFPEFGSPPIAAGAWPHTVHLYVPDVDAAFQQAVAAGATPEMPPADMFWGDRYGMLSDPFGHRWSIATHKQDLTPEQLQEAARNMPMQTNCEGSEA
jgi:PhnB protein